MVKCESLRINMFRITHTGKSMNVPVTKTQTRAISTTITVKEIDWGTNQNLKWKKKKSKKSQVRKRDGSSCKVLRRKDFLDNRARFSNRNAILNITFDSKSKNCIIKLLSKLTLAYENNAQIFLLVNEANVLKNIFWTQTAASSGILKIVRTELFLYVSTHNMQINIIKKKWLFPPFWKWQKPV